MNKILKHTLLCLIILIYCPLFNKEYSYAAKTSKKVSEYRKHLKDLFPIKGMVSYKGKKYIKAIYKNPIKMSNESYLQIQEKFPDVSNSYYLLHKSTKAYFNRIPQSQIISSINDYIYITTPLTILGNKITVSTLLDWFSNGVLHMENKPSNSKHDFFINQGVTIIGATIIYKTLDNYPNNFSLEQINTFFKWISRFRKLAKKWPLTHKMVINDKKFNVQFYDPDSFSPKQIFQRVIKNEKVHSQYLVALRNTLENKKHELHLTVYKLKQRIQHRDLNSDRKNKTIIRSYNRAQNDFQKLSELKGESSVLTNKTPLRYLRLFLVNHADNFDYPGKFMGEKKYDSVQMRVINAIGAVKYVIKMWPYKKNDKKEKASESRDVHEQSHIKSQSQESDKK